ncbi:MAG: MFS transporter [Nitrosomonas sp.]|nr:MFS transporter [Nitrosomonas sp.]
MFDFANSGYTTVVITAIFNAYFVSVVANNESWATFAWTASLAASYALIILTAPLVGAYADAYAVKKPLLAISTFGCVVFTALLYFVGKGDIGLAVILIIITNYFFGSGENLIAAFLPELAKKQALGKVSGWGWGLGYLGGIFCLGICFVYITWAKTLNHEPDQYVPVVMVITAVIFAVASLPTFIYLKERAIPQPHLYGDKVIQESFLRLRSTIVNVRQYQDLVRFLICLVFYQAGIQTVIALAAIYAQQVMGFDTQETILMIFLVNFTAALGAFAFGYMQDKLGHLVTIAITLAGWIVMIMIAWLAEDRTTFWIAANLAGLCLGASQSAGRALIGLFSPVFRRAEFFGLWGLAVKLSSILGPLTYGSVSWITNGDHRLAMLITGSYFIIGLLILTQIKIDRGQQAALRN